MGSATHDDGKKEFVGALSYHIIMGFSKKMSDRFGRSFHVF